MNNLNPFFILQEGPSSAVKSVFTGLKGSARTAAMKTAATTGMHNGVKLGSGVMNQLQRWNTGTQTAGKIATNAANKANIVATAKAAAPSKAMFQKQGTGTLFGQTGSAAQNSRMASQRMQTANQLRTDISGAKMNGNQQAIQNTRDAANKYINKQSQFIQGGKNNLGQRPVKPVTPTATATTGANAATNANPWYKRAGQGTMAVGGKLLKAGGMLAGGTALAVGGTAAAGLAGVNSLANSAGAIIHGPNRNNQ